jgi:hypothetical protein
VVVPSSVVEAVEDGPELRKLGQKDQQVLGFLYAEGIGRWWATMLARRLRVDETGELGDNEKWRCEKGFFHRGRPPLIVTRGSGSR